jgi:hypothetical protein
MAETTPTKATDLNQLGVSGLNRSGGYIQEEFLRQLKGAQGTKTYREMRDNDEVIGGILFATEMLLRSVDWRTEAASDDPKAVEVADFVEGCRHDMSHSWEDFVSEVLSMLTFGYAPHEVCYKRRNGPLQKDSTQRSKYSDGMIGWRKLPLRAQESVDEWLYDENGGLLGVRQHDPVTGRSIDIPIDKMLLFRPSVYKSNPEGRSALRNAYRAWYFKKNIQQIEAIGIERDLAGLPVAKVPAELLSASAGSDESAALDAIKTIVRNIRRDEQEGVVWPLVYDDNGNELYKLELLSSSGARQFDTNEIINRYDKRIAATMLADFILLGQDKVGSFALSSDKTALFATALGAWLKAIAEVLNRFAIPRLLQVNSIDPELAPTFVPSDIEKPDVEAYFQALNQAVLAGIITPDASTEEKAREMLDLPMVEGEG